MSLCYLGCLRFTPVGRSFFFPPTANQLNPIGGGLEIWFGYYQSVRLGQWKPTVNLDISATTFLQPGPVLNYIAEHMDISIDGLRRIPFLNNFQISALNKKLKRKQIRITHLKYRPKSRILKLTRESANQKYFVWNRSDESRRISIAQYFKENYGRILEYPNLPCLQVTPEDKNKFLPIEVCEFTPGQHSKSKLSQIQKSEMIKFTSVPPVERFRKIDNIVRKVNFNADKCVREFEVQVSARPLDVDGRIMDAPSVVYSGERQIRPVNGSWNLRDTQFISGAKISRTVLLNFSRIPFPILRKFGELLVDIGTKLGMEIGGPPRIQNAAMDRDKTKLLSEVKENADLVIIVIPSMEEIKENAFYREIKRTAETVVGLTTQCIKENTVRSVNGKRGPQIVNNLCLKINVKRYGENNSLVISQVPNILRKPVIIIGADVNHPAITENNRISLAACVGSLDSICKRCAVSVRAQVYSHHEQKSKEIICELQTMVKELLLAFYRHTSQKKPEKIIFYRDGVSEGEFTAVKRHEIVSIRKACKSLQDDYEPGITFIVVQKRHHIRFKPQDPREGAGRAQNVPSGTVVDTVVTHPLNFDFFLFSHHGALGTSRPGHYTVLEDDNEFSANDLQKMTFQLCHMYARCTKSISLPAPVAYAHLAAYRARKHLETIEGPVTDSSSSKDFALDYTLVQEQIDAIKVVDKLKNSMYFV